MPKAKFFFVDDDPVSLSFHGIVPHLHNNASSLYQWIKLFQGWNHLREVEAQNGPFDAVYRFRSDIEIVGKFRLRAHDHIPQKKLFLIFDFAFGGNRTIFEKLIGVSKFIATKVVDPSLFLLPQKDAFIKTEQEILSSQIPSALGRTMLDRVPYNVDPRSPDYPQVQPGILWRGNINNNYNTKRFSAEVLIAEHMMNLGVPLSADLGFQCRLFDDRFNDEILVALEELADGTTLTQDQRLAKRLEIYKAAPRLKRANCLTEIIDLIYEHSPDSIDQQAVLARYCFIDEQYDASYRHATAAQIIAPEDEDCLRQFLNVAGKLDRHSEAVDAVLSFVEKRKLMDTAIEPAIRLFSHFKRLDDLRGHIEDSETLVCALFKFELALLDKDFDSIWLQAQRILDIDALRASVRIRAASELVAVGRIAQANCLINSPGPWADHPKVHEIRRKIASSQSTLPFNQ
jgi:hypothetical protein